MSSQKDNEGIGALVLVACAISILGGGSAMTVILACLAFFWGLPLFWNHVALRTFNSPLSRNFLIGAAFCVLMAILCLL